MNEVKEELEIIKEQTMKTPSFKDLVGKTLLVNFKIYTKDEELIEQTQQWGTIIKADKKHITIRQNNGETFSVPPELKAIEPAPEGEYTLRSTGEVVTDPDYISEWSIYKKG